jgi:hypothetical protein
MYFNTLNNLFSRNISLSIRFLCLFDFYRQTFIYFRYFIMILFIKRLVTETTINDILYLIPFIVFVILPYMYFMCI